MFRSSTTLQNAHRVLRVCDFGEKLVPYTVGLQLQERLARLCKEQAISDTLLQLQHPPVYTLGKRGRQEDFLLPCNELEEKGAEICNVGRGGETTFHGPGQLVCYPIVNLRRLSRGARAYVEGIEDTIIACLEEFGMSAKGRQPSRTGVWIDDRKIAAIGVQISHGVTTHGLAVNVSNDLSYFDHIVPCGIADKEVTSVRREIGVAPPMHELSDVLRRQFVNEFQYSGVMPVSPEELMDQVIKQA